MVELETFPILLGMCLKQLFKSAVKLAYECNGYSISDLECGRRSLC